jgi:hypothetical protein
MPLLDLRPQDSTVMFEFGLRLSPLAPVGTLVAVDTSAPGAARSLGDPPYTGGRYVVLANPKDAAQNDFRWKCLDVLVALMEHQASGRPSGYVSAKHTNDEPENRGLN